MSGISTSTGLISGLPIQDIIDQLMQLEARPRVMVENRNKDLTAQQTALKDLNTMLLGLKTSALQLTLPTAFTKTKATSSNESVLTVTSSAGASPGNYAFNVKRLVQAQQTITRGFADKDATPVAPSGGTLTFERGEARLESTTLLSTLNGGAGISRGLIRITDRSGASAVVDLSDVATVDDVIEKINSTTGISVFAEIQGDRLKISDMTGQTTSGLVIADVGTTGTATSLGIAGTVAADSLTGTQINNLGEASLLSNLNDGTGIRNKTGAADLRISVGGTDHDINIDGMASIGEVFAAIEAATGGAVTGSFTADGSGIRLNGPAGFTVSSINGSGTAEDLGIAGTADGSGALDGSRLIANINSKLLRNLNGGLGANLGTIAITNRAGGTTNVDLSGAASVSDIIDRINEAGAGVTAGLNSAGNGLLLTDTSGGTGTMSVSDVSGTAAAELKLTNAAKGDTLDTGNLEYKYIAEGTRLDQLGIALGKFVITDSSGGSATVDLSAGDAVTIGDVIAKINSRGLDINARINDTGDGILIEDTGPGTVKMKIEDQGSTTAKDLGLAGEAANPGDNIDGTFEKTIEVAATDTLQDIATKIAEAKIGLNAAVISDGSPAAPYRLSITAKQGGTGNAFVFDDGGLGLGATNLAEAQDAVVFYGSADPAKALVITSRTNTLDTLVPGAKVTLHATSREPVQITIAKDEQAITDSVKAFVDKFNEITTKIEEVDSYDAETKTRGILLGDSAVATVRTQLFNILIRRNNDLTGQYNSLAQIGITIGKEAQVEFDAEKFAAAMSTDPEAVEALFTFKETELNDEGKKVTTARGIGVAIDELLNRLTDPEFGPLSARVSTIEDQIANNNRTIADLNKRLENKRGVLERQFAAMESALAKMQDQSSALVNLQQLAAQTRRS